MAAIPDAPSAMTEAEYLEFERQSELKHEFLNGEIFAIGGGRIARMMIAENEGVIGSGASIEEVRDMMPQVIADTSFFHPKDLGERSADVDARAIG